MSQTFHTFFFFLKIQLVVDHDKRSLSHLNTMAFFFCEEGLLSRRVCFQADH